MIKLVLQTIPIHIMSCFKLPLTICKKINSEISNFLWNSNTNSKKPHWISWEDLCNQMVRGRLVLRDLVLFNQAWKMIFEQDSLLSQFFKSAYYKSASFLQAPNPAHSSYIWKDIIWGRNLLEQGIGWRIGDGSTSHIWDSNCLPGKFFFKPVTLTQFWLLIS